MDVAAKQDQTQPFAPGGEQSPVQDSPTSEKNPTRVVQPALARRTKQFLRMLIIGTVCGVTSGFLMVFASSQLTRFDRSPKLWVLVGNMSAIFLALICVMQCFLWIRSLGYWLGKYRLDLGLWIYTSRFGAGVSWLLLFLIPLSGVQIARLDIYGGRTFWIALIASLLSIFGCLFSARWQVRLDGPPLIAPEVIVRNVPSKGRTRRYRIRTGKGGRTRRIRLHLRNKPAKPKS